MTSNRRFMMEGVARTSKIQWIPPPVGVLNINVDRGSLEGANTGAFSAICRDEQGCFRGCSSVNVEGISNPVCFRSNGMHGDNVFGR
jgi:hypothetical protein